MFFGVVELFIQTGGGGRWAVLFFFFVCYENRSKNKEDFEWEIEQNTQKKRENG